MDFPTRDSDKLNSRHERAGNVLPIKRERQKSETFVSVATTENVGENSAGAGVGVDGCETEDRETVKGRETVEEGDQCKFVEVTSL